MLWKENCAVVIPCLNEARTIGPLCAAVRRFLPAVWVVDDGSNDATTEHARRSGATAVRHFENRGKGAAIRTGIDAAKKAGFSWVLLLDGDGQHDPDDIPLFLDCASKSNAAIVVGNRMHDAKRIPWIRRGVNRWMSRRISKRVDLELPDTQCGFRMIRVQVWDFLETHTSHYEIESEMLVKAVELGFLVRFVPIRVIGRGPESGISPLLDTWRWITWWWSARTATNEAREPAEANT